MEIVTFGRDKESGRSAKQFDGFFDVLKSGNDGNESPLRVGIFSKDKHEGPMVEEWASYLAGHSAEFESVDAAPGVAMCLAIKDSDESVRLCVELLGKYLIVIGKFIFDRK